MKGFLAVALTVALAGWGPARMGTAAEAIITPAQIEADFLKQNELREHPRPAPSRSKSIAPQEDARGGVDGHKDGKWGFHTQNEDRPWWQVDLGQSLGLGRIVLYNRCDATAARTARILVLLSDDGQEFRPVYQHNGAVFYGFTDQKPLDVPLQGAQARYVRLQLPGKSYFHLDEVEIYAPGGKQNIALGRLASQSSTSSWSVCHPQAPVAPAVVEFATAKAIDRGLQLAEHLRTLGVAVDADMAALAECRRRLKALAADAAQESQRQLYLDARWAVRRLALRNPLLDFDTLLFCKAAPGRFPHMSDQFYGWWSRPGGGIFLLEGIKSAEPRLRCLTTGMPEGSFLRPELSYDGRKVLFAYCRYFAEVPDLKDKASKAQVPEEAFYHLYEMNVDGTGRRRLTHGKYDDFDGRYLPSGEIVFLSTRKGQFLQCSDFNTRATTTGDLPDSYVRCGGNDYRPVPVFTLHAMDAQGRNLRPLSAFENFEWTPAVAHDGRILYTRWDYIDRFNGHFFSLWSTNPDGTNPQLVYGNYTVRPQVVAEAVPIPNSCKLVFTASAHHAILGGSLGLLDRTRGSEGEEPLVRLTPEVPFPETEANVDSYYACPCPLSEEHYLVGWSDRRLPPHARVEDNDKNPVNAMGLYLYDVFGNLNLLHRDAAISSCNPLPLRPRAKPPIYGGSLASAEASEGTFLLQDVYQGLAGVERGSVKAIRVIGVAPKVQPHMNKPVVGVSREDPAKFLLGTAPVEPDGSAFFRAPSGMSVLFQAVDAEGMAVQTMRSLTYVMPDRTVACIGCHESRDSAPTSAARFPLAAQRPPSRLTPGPAGSWPMRYDQLVQPVLNKHCVSCHRPGGTNARAAAFDLTETRSYDTLLAYGEKDLYRLAFERDRSLVGDCAARQSKLLALLRDPQGHEGLFLDRASLERLVVWMDLYAQRRGHYSDQQEEQLRQLRARLTSLVQP